MEHFDHDYVSRMWFRLGRIEKDAKPKWGTMTPRDLVRHLADTLRYVMGRLGDLPEQRSFFTRHIAKPLLLRGLLPIPKNVRGPAFGKSGRRPEDDLESLHAVIAEYLALVQAGELRPKPHPVFGPLSVDEWARLHVVHFEHHLRQFRV